MAVEKIVVGRNREDLKEFGIRGTAFIGKHIVGEGEESHLTNALQMDVTRPHVLLICGKRGTGKSYSGAVIAEEIALLPPQVRNNLSVLMFDTMGIYWSMKQPNTKDAALLRKWGMKPRGLPIKLFVPKGYVKSYKEAGVSVDAPLTLPAGELTATDWILTFGFSPIDEYGIVIERIIKAVKERNGSYYSINDIVFAIQADKKIDSKIKDALVNRFLAAMEWGIFEKTGTPVNDLFQPGVISVIDVSHYMSVSQGWSVKGMLVGLLARKIFQKRLMARKAEEFEVMSGERKKTVPMVWMLIDECHQFLPSTGQTAASEPLHTIIKQGREPGISLLMITQRPNRLHEDALAQADLVISHRLTAKADLEALRGVMQTYMLDDIQEYINTLPRTKGAAIVLDDNSERIYAVQVRPRLTWHAGGSPSALKKKSLFD
ncbi:MAG: ATP-binding protein [Candidatus Aenigmarchaeota archaeon]|nr:ATP-binding protein [Candidatus Aenigmarchaeota archaeon]